MTIIIMIRLIITITITTIILIIIMIFSGLRGASRHFSGPLKGLSRASPGPLQGSWGGLGGRVVLDLFSSLKWVRSSGYSGELLGQMTTPSGPFLVSRTGDEGVASLARGRSCVFLFARFCCLLFFIRAALDSSCRESTGASGRNYYITLSYISY